VTANSYLSFSLSLLSVIAFIRFTSAFPLPQLRNLSSSLLYFQLIVIAFTAHSYPTSHLYIPIHSLIHNSCNSRIFPHKFLHFHSHRIHISLPDYSFTILHSYTRMHFLMDCSYTIILFINSHNNRQQHFHTRNPVTEIENSLAFHSAIQHISIQITVFFHRK